jgi:hypothetical protein
LTAAQKVHHYSLARREAWLARNAEGLALFQVAQKAPCVYPQDGSTDDFAGGDQSSIRIAVFRDLAHDISKQSRTLALQGKWDAAASAAVQVVEMGCRIKSGAPDLGAFLGDDIQDIGWARLADLSHVSAREARASARLLDGALTGEESLVEMQRAQKREAELGTRKFIASWTPWLHLPGISLYLVPSRGWFPKLRPANGVMADVAAAADERIADASQPFTGRKRVFSMGSFPPYYLSGESNDRWAHSRHRAHSCLMLLRLALHAYRLAEGAYPASLSRLTPGILSAVPFDPFGNGRERLRYRSRGAGYLVWSIGPDGKNDNGRPITVSPHKRHLPPIDTSVGDIVMGP